MKENSIVNSNGIEVIKIDLIGDSEDPRITLSDSNGIPRICIGLDQGLPFISLLHTNGSLMIGLGENKDSFGGTVASNDGQIISFVKSMKTE